MVLGFPEWSFICQSAILFSMIERIWGLEFYVSYKTYNKTPNEFILEISIDQMLQLIRDIYNFNMHFNYKKKMAEFCYFESLFSNLRKNKCCPSHTQKN